jgi:methanogenic corrinoid protein MtbC1
MGSAVPHTTPPVADLMTNYALALTQGSGRLADRVVQAAFDAGLNVNQIYLDIFQPAAYEVGRLWETRQISIVQEHLSTGIIERQMGELHLHFRPRQDRRRSIVLGCVADEFHRIGVRMAADFFEQDGWTVHYLGAAVPTAEFVGMAGDLKPDVIGVSCLVSYHLSTISKVTGLLRRAGIQAPIIAGGYVFIQHPELADGLGITGMAANAQAAIELANRLLA